MDIGIGIAYPPIGGGGGGVQLVIDAIAGYTVTDNIEVVYASIIKQDGTLIINGRLVGV